MHHVHSPKYSSGQSASIHPNIVRSRTPSVPLHSRVLQTLLPALMLSFALLLSLCPANAFAQGSATSSVTGHVTDSTGAVVPGAIVHITNTATSAERTATTNNSGEYSITNLPPANYRVRIEKSGFKTSTIASLDLLVDQTADGSVTLSVGSTTETVEVTTAPPALQTTEATVGQVIDQKQVNDLPLNGRNVLQLATLAAGVSPAQTGNTGTPGSYGTRNLFITVDGGRASSTNYVLDGTYVRSIRFNNLSLQPSIDTIQEFNLLRSTYSTEYGQGDAVVSMVTKSGTNSLHGTAYIFTRDAIFDARNWAATYTSTPKKPTYHRQQFGGTLGLPLWKDHAFLFGGYEGLRTSRGVTQFGLFPCPLASCPGFSTTIAPILGTPPNQAESVLQPYFPVPNCTTCGTANDYSSTQNFTDNYDEYVIRADQTLSQKSTLFERYIDFNAQQFSPAVQQGVGTNYPLISRNMVIGNTYLLTPSIVNDLRLGYNRVYSYYTGHVLVPGTNFTSTEGLTNLTGLTSPTQDGRSSIAISGFSTISDPGRDQGSTEDVYSFGDSVGFVRGRHTIKGGFQFQWRQITQIADNNARGSFTFAATSANVATGTPAYSGIQNYQRGLCTSCNGGFGTTLGHYRDNTYGAFISDIWQIGHGFTLNAGIRWEYNSPFVEQNGLEGAFSPSLDKIAFHKVPANIPAFLLPNVDTTPNYFPAGIINPYKKGFGPRLGLAYQASPTTVARLGYGIYFDNINANELQFTRYAAPLYYQITLNNQNIAGLFPNINTLTSAPAPFSVDPKNTVPYSQEFTVSVQQEFGHNTTFELAYTGSDTHRLWKRYDQNEDIFNPDGTSTGVRPYPNFLHGMLTSSTRSAANFNGLSAKLEQRSTHGLFYLVNYQWSKNLDNNSGEADANDTSYATNFHFDHSYSNFDVRHRASGSAGYELPFGAGKDHLQTGIGNVLAGGWSLQPAIQLRGGYPFSVSATGGQFCTYCPQRASLAPGRTSGALSHKTPQHWFDPTAYVVPSVAAAGLPDYNPSFGAQGNVTRNTLRGPGTAQVDFSAIKNFKLYETLHAQFRAEAFNIINRANLANPAANISTPSSAGVITATSTGGVITSDNRDLQFALKFLW
jgi:hypothetical protein